MHHSILERLQEVLLELETWQLFLFQEAHRELSQRVQSEIADVGIAVAAHLERGGVSHYTS